MLAIDIGTRHVVTVKHGASLSEAADLMHEATVGCLVVLDEDGAAVGMVTDRDLCLGGVATEHTGAHLSSVSGVMTTPLETLPATATVCEAAERMRELGVRRLVIGGPEAPIGIVAQEDILAVLAGVALDLEAASIDRRVEEARHRKTDHLLESIGGLPDRIRAAGWRAREEFLGDLDRLEDLVMGPRSES